MSYEIHIRPNQRWWRLPLAELWAYRDLFLLLVRRDFIAKYKQTLLGPAWFFLQPLFTTVVFTIVFGTVAKIPTDGIPPFLFYLCGLLPWNFFTQTMTANAATFLNNAGIFGKVYFPRLISPLATSFSSLFALVIQFLTFVGFLTYYVIFHDLPGPALDLRLLAIPLLILQTGCLALGLGLWFSSITAKYRDLGFLVSFMAQLWMYATPVVYPLSQIPEAWRWAALLNPMAPIVEAFRLILLGQGSWSPGPHALSVAVSLTILYSGVLLFQRVQRTFVDTV